MASLPGLNIFTSEWLLLRGLLFGAVASGGIARVALLGGVLAIVFTGGLAVACFVRVAGVGLLGSPRTAGAEAAPRPGWTMILPLLLLAAACVTLGVIPGSAAGALSAAVNVVAPAAEAAAAARVLAPLAVVGPLLAGAAVLLLALRAAVRQPAPLRQTATWGCGYATPSAAMQYTSTSFAQPLTRVLQPLLRMETHHAVDPGQAPVWPRAARWASRTADRALVGIYLPLFAAIARAGQRVRAYHQAGITWSLLYIGATVLVVLTLLALPAVGR
jgi:hypothetical protein